MMARTSKRPREQLARGHFVGARINDETRHLLEVLAQLHQESFAAIIERALNELRQKDIALGGAYQPKSDDGGTESMEGFDIARETWAPEEWLRHLKMFLTLPALVPPVERAFWKEICEPDDPMQYWIPRDAVDLSPEQQRRLGAHVLAISIPYEEAIENAWNAFIARNRQ